MVVTGNFNLATNGEGFGSFVNISTQVRTQFDCDVLIKLVLEMKRAIAIAEKQSAEKSQ